MGDRLVLPDTRHIKETEVTGGGWLNAVNQWEERTLLAVSPDGRTLTLNAPLLYDHRGARDFNGVLEFLPHIGNLTRNVIVRSANPSGTRGHMVGIHMADLDIRYALFRDLGRTTFRPLHTTDNPTGNHIGRYPVHIHHVSGPVEVPPRDHQFKLMGNAVDGGSAATEFKWGIAVHGSHYGLIQDNVVYNYNGAAIATEDGSESYNVFDHNFVLRGMGLPNVQMPSGEIVEARSALGTEGVGFWFRGPNNFVTNNIAANFQNSTTEAAYGFVYQFRFLGDIKVPNFRGADTMGLMGPNQFTLMNGNNLPLLQFENNEAYGAMQGGLTYWWISSKDPEAFAGATESVIKNFKAWHIYNKGVYIYPGQKVTFDGLKIRGNYVPGSRCCGDGVYFADYMAKDIVIRNSDIQGMEQGIIAPMAGFGPNPQPDDRRLVPAKLGERHGAVGRVRQRLLDGQQAGRAHQQPSRDGAGHVRESHRHGRRRGLCSRIVPGQAERDARLRVQRRGHGQFPGVPQQPPGAAAAAHRLRSVDPPRRQWTGHVRLRR